MKNPLLYFHLSHKNSGGSYESSHSNEMESKKTIGASGDTPPFVNQLNHLFKANMKLSFGDTSFESGKHLTKPKNDPFKKIRIRKNSDS